MASLQQQAIILALRVTRRKRLWQDPERLIQDAREQQKAWPVRPPGKIVDRVRVETDERMGFPVYTFAPNPGSTTNGRSALYIHGGGYIHDFGPGHFKLIATLVERAGLTVVAPCYPLVPDHNWRDSFEQVAALGRGLNGPGKPLLIGDSAGGGFALAVAEVLAAEALQPETVLLSPYGDALVSDPGTPEYDSRDPYLAAAGVRTVLTAWAGDDDPERPEVSPLFGRFAGIARMLILTGTNDTIHPQALQIHAKAQTDRVASKLVVAQGCIHVYPLMPIPEAKKALEHMLDFIAEEVASAR